MNNEVLDVAIGLTFIYLLYSLLATTIKELVAVMFAYRAKMLERGIEQMLDGENYSNYWWSKLRVGILMLFKDTSDQMKAMGKKKASAEADGLVAEEPEKAVQPVAPKRKEKKPTMRERAISYCKDDDVTLLNNTQLCKKVSLFAAEITSHTLYLRSAENSMMSKAPAYLPAKVFSNILIDVLGHGGDGPVLLKDIADNIKEKAANHKDPLCPETAKILNIYIKQANGDMQRFKLLIENWYDETMSRVSGWYKRLAFRVTLIIGFVLAVVFNVDTIGMVHSLSTNKTVREAMVKKAVAYVDTSVKSDSPQTLSGPSVKPDSKPAKIKDGVDKIESAYRESIEANTTLGLGWGDFGFKEDSLARNTAIKCLTVEIEVETNPTKKDSLRKELATQKDAQPNRNDFGYKISHLGKGLVSLSLIGWLITALAISLGAPFWFDLLNKFINLRASGKKPEEEESANSPCNTLNQKPAPNSFG